MTSSDKLMQLRNQLASHACCSLAVDSWPPLHASYFKVRTDAGDGKDFSEHQVAIFINISRETQLQSCPVFVAF